MEGEIAPATAEDTEALTYRKYELPAPLPKAAMPSPLAAEGAELPPRSSREHASPAAERHLDTETEEPAPDRASLPAQPGPEPPGEIPMRVVPRWLFAFLLTGVVAFAALAYRSIWP